MELLNNIAKQLLTDTNADGKIDLADATASLQNLIADASGKLDLNGMIAKFNDLGLSETVSSWIAEGENKLISSEQISQIFDTEKLSQFAASLSVDLDTAKNALANAIPNLIAQASSGGELMEKVNEGIAAAQESAAEVVAAATTQSEGLLAKIKSFFS